MNRILTLALLCVAGCTRTVPTGPSKQIVGIERVSYQHYETPWVHDSAAEPTERVYYKLHAADGTFTISDCPPSFAACKWARKE